jgi:uncharacterized membrane protein YciS (DUF1049 family)
MKVGLIMMVLALALVIGAVVVSVTLGSEPERAASFAEVCIGIGSGHAGTVG